MSIKEMEFNGNDVVPSEDLSLRTCMENLIIKGSNIQFFGSNSVFLRQQSSQLEDKQLKQTEDNLKQLEVCAAQSEEAGSMDKCQRKMTDKGRERKFLTKKGNS